LTATAIIARSIRDDNQLDSSTNTDIVSGPATSEAIGASFAMRCLPPAPLRSPSPTRSPL